MIKYVSEFGSQLLDAIDRFKNIPNVKKTGPIHNIVISGLGGSGIGGSLIQDYMQHIQSSIPVIVNKDYVIPSYVDKNTLFIACSYSGNTEETLEAYSHAVKKKAQICIVTSGGALMEIAKKKKHTLLELPTGFPPRASFAYGVTALLTALKIHGVIKTKFTSDLYEAVAIITEEEKHLRKISKSIAKKMHDHHIVLYAGAGNEAITVRFRQQINENSKQLALHHIYPEMNHNELVGWRNKGRYCVINLFTGYEHKRTKARFEITKPIIKKYCKSMIDLHAQGSSWLACSLYLVHLTDIISCDLADLNKRDSIEVKVIDTLKKALSELK